jgi:pilus assembly protein Flp/PilA
MSLMQFIAGHGPFARWCRERRAATAIEYGLIAGGISILIVAAVLLMGGSLSDLFSMASGAMEENAARVADR